MTIVISSPDCYTKTHIDSLITSFFLFVIFVLCISCVLTTFFLLNEDDDDDDVCCCGPGGRWWQPTTGFMTVHAVICRLTALTLDNEYGYLYLYLLQVVVHSDGITGADPGRTINLFIASQTPYQLHRPIHLLFNCKV